MIWKEVSVARDLAEGNQHTALPAAEAAVQVQSGDEPTGGQLIP
jgi:hypothetical protein